ncbi:lipid-binding SYLF domain-containing protein [Sulfurospirillum arcachonense]|uniref:lipid-binding SYLF domain-containing protein n=1 Tax=Sulfurospirillum arcachonense TaxID=57666 RepID=UPI00046999D0|nr:lipid-binding SYLF domain-containing protein [Sulfurospirillum arcachonense]
MKRLLIILLLVFCVTNLFADSVEEKVLESTNSMKKLIRNRNGIPIQIIQKAQAIVIIPSSVKVGIFIGMKYGEGVASIRKADGSWSYPFFIKISGGSLGFQLGVESADSIFVFRTQNSVNELLKNKFTIGVGASASAGPIGANIEKNSEINMQAEIFTYSQTKGLFAGASFEGAVLSNDENKNKALYGGDISVNKIVTSENLSDVYSVQEFLKNIENLTR